MEYKVQGDADMKNTFTDREKHALYEGLMMPISCLFHKRIPLSEGHYAYSDDDMNETHYVQLGETITVVTTAIVVGITAILIWRKHATRNG